MLLLDGNVLIYAFRRDLPQHTTAKRWLERKLSADEPLELLVLSELAFLRITRNRRALAQPSRFEEALRFLEPAQFWPAPTAALRVSAVYDGLIRSVANESSNL